MSATPAAHGGVVTTEQSAASARLERRLPTIHAAVAIFIAYYLGAKIGFALTPVPQPVSTLWPPNALLLGVLLVVRVRTWPIVLASAFVAHLAVELHSGVPLGMVLGWYVSNIAEALIGAALMRRVIDPPVRFDSVRHVAVFIVCAVVIAPFLSSFLDAAFVAWNDWGEGSYWEVWSARFFSNVIAILTIVPPIIALGTGGAEERRRVPFARVFEASVLVATVLVVCTLVFSVGVWQTTVNPAWLYAPLPLLLWAAVRFGPGGTSVCLLIFVLTSIWGAIHGRGPFTDGEMQERVLSLQLFLTLVAVSLLGLTAAVRELGRAEEKAREAAAQLNLTLSAADVFTWDWHLARDIGIWRGSARIFGMSGDMGEMNGEWSMGKIAPEDRPTVDAAIRAAIDRNESYAVEYRVVQEDGTSRWALSKGTAMRDGAGRPVRIIGVTADITERRQWEDLVQEEALLRASEAQLRELADAMPQIVYAANASGEIDYLNRKWYEITGCTPEAVALGNWANFLHPADRDAWVGAWLDSVRLGRAHEHEGRFWSEATSSYRWHLSRALPVRDETGGIVRWYGTATDIDDQKRIERELRDKETNLRELGRQLEIRVADRTRELSQANRTLREEIRIRHQTENALRASEERFAKAFRASPDAIVITRHPEGRIIEVNERWEELFEYGRDAVIGRTLDELRVFADGRDGRRIGHAMGVQGFVKDLELTFCSRNGADIRGVVSAERVEMAGERCVVTTIRDVTEHRRAEHEIAVQRRELAHLGRVALLGELSGALAHELNQPLAAILANARAAQRMLLRDPLDIAELRAIMDDIVADDRRAGAVISRVRGLIRKGEAEPQLVLTNDVVGDVLELTHSDLIQRGITVETRLAASLPLVYADRIQLQQVVLNLIVNACEAMADTPHGERMIVIATTRVGDAVEIAVTDHGGGIAPAQLESVFEPFVTSKPHGLGLGLAICRSLVDSVGGRMWATNNDDRGATFHVRLPAAPSAVPALTGISA